MSERKPATLEFLARQQDRMLAVLASLRDDVNVLTAIVQRLDNSHRSRGLGWNIPKNTKGRDVSSLIKAVIAMARDIATAVDSAGLLRRRRRRWRKWRNDKGKDGVS